MGRSHFMTVLCLFSIVVDCSSAYSVWNLRRLISETPKENSTGISNSPVPSPAPAEANSTVRSGDDSGKENPAGAKPLNDSDKGNPVSGNDKINASVSPPTNELKDDGKIQDQGKEQKAGKANSGSSHNGSCEGSFKKCNALSQEK